MKRVRCPKCDAYITFDETRYADGQKLVFECQDCKKRFSIRIGGGKPVVRKNETPDGEARACGHIVVIENVFHHKQVIPLQMGDNVIGRYVNGTGINTTIETSDPSIDTKHCIIRVRRGEGGGLQYILRDAPSNTGTFYNDKMLRDTDRIRLEDGGIITIGATSIILRTAGRQQPD